MDNIIYQFFEIHRVLELEVTVENYKMALEYQGLGYNFCFLAGHYQKAPSVIRSGYFTFFENKYLTLRPASYYLRKGEFCPIDVVDLGGSPLFYHSDPLNFVYTLNDIHAMKTQRMFSGLRRLGTITRFWFYFSCRYFIWECFNNAFINTYMSHTTYTKVYNYNYKRFKV